MNWTKQPVETQIAALNSNITTTKISSGYTLASAVNQYGTVSITKMGNTIVVNLSLYTSGGATIAKDATLLTFTDLEAKYTAYGVLSGFDEDNTCIPITINSNSKVIVINRPWPTSKRYNGQIVFTCK